MRSTIQQQALIFPRKYLLSAIALAFIVLVSACGSEQDNARSRVSDSQLTLTQLVALEMEDTNIYEVLLDNAMLSLHESLKDSYNEEERDFSAFILTAREHARYNVAAGRYGYSFHNLVSGLFNALEQEAQHLCSITIPLRKEALMDSSKHCHTAT